MVEVAGQIAPMGRALTFVVFPWFAVVAAAKVQTVGHLPEAAVETGARVPEVLAAAVALAATLVPGAMAD
jgi:hypothetical protein